MTNCFGPSECFGNEVEKLRPVLSNYTQPIENGIITNFEVMEKIWQYVFFNELRVDPSEDMTIILTEKYDNPTNI